MNAREVQPRLGVPVYGGLWGDVVSRDWTYGGHSGQVQETKKACHIREERRIQGTGKGQKITAPFHAMGPAPGAQRGRTAVTQVV